MRADQALVSLALAPSRSAAQRLIERGAVELLGAKGWERVQKASLDVAATTQLRLTDDAELRYVSRGGLKLEAALAQAQLCARGLICLDLGQSTGGFTDVLLRQGAARVVGLDVGHSQLHPSLKSHPQVRSFEGINARDFELSELGEASGFDLIVGDLSFISLCLVLQSIYASVKSRGQVLHLVKPQFELDATKVGKGGIVKDPAHFELVRERVCSAALALRFEVLNYFDSAITGGDGNREFFIHLRKP